MTTEQLTDIVCDEVAAAIADNLAGKNPPGAWVAVRLASDGTVYTTEEVSPCYSEAEYYRRVPHTLTAWSHRVTPWNGPEEDCPVDSDGVWIADETAVDEYVRAEIERKIEEWVEAGNLTAAEAHRSSGIA